MTAGLEDVELEVTQGKRSKIPIGSLSAVPGRPLFDVTSALSSTDLV